MDILTDYLGEFILLIGIAFLKLIGKDEDAEKLIKKRKKKRNKRKKKLCKRLEKESKCVERDLDELKELEKED